MTIRSTLVSRVEGIIDRTDLTARIKTAFNTVMNRIARKYDFNILMDEDTSVTTVVSTFTYTLPTNTHRIYRIIYEDGSNSVDLNEISAAEFDRRYPYPSSLGDSTPRDYCRRNETTIDLCHPPDDTNTLRIFRSKWPTELTTDNSEPEYIRMDDVLIAGVVAEIYKQLDLADDYKTWMAEFMSLLNDAYERDKESPNLIQQLRGWGQSPQIMGDYWKNPFYKG